MRENNYTLNIKEMNIQTDENNIGETVAAVVKYYFKKMLEMNQNLNRNSMNLSQLTISKNNISLQNEDGDTHIISRKSLAKG